VKVGDLIQYTDRLLTDGSPNRFGTVIDFPLARHAKEFQKVRVLTEEGIEDWVMQFCKVVSEHR